MVGSHSLSRNFLAWSRPAIIIKKNERNREGLGQRAQLLTLHRKEIGYPPLSIKTVRKLLGSMSFMMFRWGGDKLIYKHFTLMIDFGNITEEYIKLVLSNRLNEKTEF